MLSFSRELAIALHDEEERLYRESQVHQQPQQQPQHPRARDQAHSAQSKKSKNKQKKPSYDDDGDHKESCNLS